MLSKEEIEKSKNKLNEILKEWQQILNIKDPIEREIESNLYMEEMPFNQIKVMLSYIDQLESENYEQNNIINSYIEREQKLIEKLEERIKCVEQCYQDLIKPYYDKKLKLINTSLMTKKEKEEFTNKRNCLLVQKHCYKEILKILKGEKE